MASKEETSFKPHHHVDLDTPAYHLIMKPALPILRPLLAGLYALRWQLSRPLQTRVVPKWMIIPFFHDANYFTYGEILLRLPPLIFLLMGILSSFVSPSVEHSGKATQHAILTTFFTASKSNSIPAFVLGISFERMIPIHRLSALIAVSLAFFHASVSYRFGEDEESEEEGHRLLSSEDEEESEYGLLGTNPNFFKYLFEDDRNTSGALAAFAMTALVILSTFPILRRRFFDFWLWTHIALALCVIITVIMHKVPIILFAAIWWGMDVIIRYVVQAACMYPRKATITKVHDDVVEIRFPKPAGFEYNPGQFVQISVWELGVLAFHPVSISSAPHEEDVTFHLRGLGNWTRKLVQLADSQNEISILMEGPYGAISVDLDDDNRYQMVLCVSGGIGVTHCQSVAKSVIHDYQGGRKLKHLRFVWSIRDVGMLDVMSTPLENALPQTDMENGNGNKQASSAIVSTDVYVTKSNLDKEQKSDLQSNSPRHFHYKRPDINAIVAKTARDAEKQGVTHVAVFCCGPIPLVHMVQEACLENSKSLFDGKGVVFDVHKEIFEY